MRGPVQTADIDKTLDVNIGGGSGIVPSLTRVLLECRGLLQVSTVLHVTRGLR